jgi:5'-methylthioadenosine phosphorylase/purine-nucleoside phosphorylase
MAIHLRASAGDYAPAVLCPGDPRRATYIAETFFEPGARLVNEERGLLGYTGTFEGAPISVQTTGMGCPSAGIVFEELITLGASRLVRIGTCGAIADGVAMGDTVIGLAASCDDTNPLRYAGMSGYAPAASFELVATAARLAGEGESGRAVHVGGIVSSGVFYDPDPSSVPTWTRLGILAIEMEAAMLYTVAAVKRVEALAICTVSDLVGEGTSERISDEELRRGVDAMLQIACRVAVS